MIFTISVTVDILMFWIIFLHVCAIKVSQLQTQDDRLIVECFVSIDVYGDSLSLHNLFCYKATGSSSIIQIICLRPTSSEL